MPEAVETTRRPSSSGSDVASDQLVVQFLDDQRILTPGESLAFGRQGDLIVDDANPFLHRVIGQFSNRSGAWWISNEGSRLPLVAIGEHGERAELPPGGAVAVFPGETRVLFEAGSARYELTCLFQGEQRDDEPTAGSHDGAATTDWGTIPLNFEQRQLLVSLCEPRLRSDSGDIPSNKAMAVRLGWSLKKVERKLDYMCRRFTEAGVVGLRGTAGTDAGDRRRRLADHALRMGIVGYGDLIVLEVTDQQ